jgi:hypothetical protein
LRGASAPLRRLLPFSGMGNIEGYVVEDTRAAWVRIDIKRPGGGGAKDLKQRNDNYSSRHFILGSNTIIIEISHEGIKFPEN